MYYDAVNEHDGLNQQYENDEEYEVSANNANTSQPENNQSPAEEADEDE